MGPVLVILVLVSIGVSYLSLRYTSPLLAIVGRWLRWIVVSAGCAFLLISFGWVERPFWLLTIIGLLIWLLFETMYNWAAIGALSRSTYPLFPHFQENEQGDDWPVSERFIRLKEWIENAGFQQVAKLKASLDEQMFLRSSIYQSLDDLIRLQILFVPQRGGRFVPAYVLSSKAKDGRRYVTDNFFLPFGGFYPSEWSMVRKPIVRSLAALVRLHMRRMNKADDSYEWEPWDREPIGEINRQQHQLERINTDLGFLFPRHLHDQHGMLTWEGRYRVWQELWMLSYLGRSRSY